jgi:hypothetical protein
MLLVTVGAVSRPPLGDRLCKVLEHLLSVFPIDASIGDGDAVLETWPLLVAGIALHVHNTHPPCPPWGPSGCPR